MTQNPVYKIVGKFAGDQSKWMDEQCFQHIPQWQRYLMDKLKWNWLRNLFGWGFEVRQSMGADMAQDSVSSKVIVKTIWFKHHKKTISSANFFINLNGEIQHVKAKAISN